MRPFSTVALTLAGLLTLEAHAIAEPAPGALALTWQGRADTDLKLPALLAVDHTLMARFMLQFPNAGIAPVFASQGGTGTLSVVKADYQHAMLLAVTYGNKSARFQFPKPQAVTNAEAGSPAPSADVLDDLWRRSVAGHWYHLAVVRSGNTVKLFVDGKRLSALDGNADAAGNLSLVGVSDLPAGVASKLRLGQLAAAPKSTAAFFAQFYGLIDDVAVFDKALDDASVKLGDHATVDYFAKNPHVAATEPHLVGLYNFNYDPSPIPSSIAHTWSLSGAAFLRHVDASADNVADAAKMLSPKHNTVFHLPFRRGEVFEVLWGNEINSHVGQSGAFSWDFRRVGAGVDVQKATAGQPLSAVADGRVVLAFDGGDAPLRASVKRLIDGHNILVLEHAPGEQSLYLHVKTGSITEAFTHANQLSPVNLNDGDLKANATWLKTPAGSSHVTYGLWVTRIGTRTEPGQGDNYHLHFSSQFDNTAPLFDTTDTLTNATFPLAFSDYEASDDQGQTWRYIERDIPAHHQWVRKPLQDTN